MSITSASRSEIPADDDKRSAMERIGGALAEWSENWFPDAYVFAAFAVTVVALAALALGRTPMQVAADFGGSFWTLVPFTMQMVFVLIGGYVVAVSPPVRKLIVCLARVPKTPKGAVTYVAFMAMMTSLLSWGFSLIFAGILMREISKHLRVDYRAMSAAGYLGLGSIWALGISSSAALLMATKSSIPAALYKISGVIPLDMTLFTWQNMVMIVVLLVLSCWICYASAPTGDAIKTFQDVGLNPEDSQEYGKDKASKPGEIPEHSPILSIIISLLILLYLVGVFWNKGGFAALDLNIYNLIFLCAGMILHGTPHNFLKAVARAVPMGGGMLIQFPLYAGLFGILMGSGLNDVLANFFTAISNQNTLPLIGGIYSALLGLLLPSGGAKWIVEAPYLLEVANQLHVNLAWIVQVYNAAEALPNFINPFLMLPLMGLMGIKARDMAGFTILQFIFHTPVVLAMLWLLGMTLEYVPPVFI